MSASEAEKRLLHDYRRLPASEQRQLLDYAARLQPRRPETRPPLPAPDFGRWRHEQAGY